MSSAPFHQFFEHLGHQVAEVEGIGVAEYLSQGPGEGRRAWVDLVDARCDRPSRDRRAVWEANGEREEMEDASPVARLAGWENSATMFLIQAHVARIV